MAEGNSDGADSRLIPSKPLSGNLLTGLRDLNITDPKALELYNNIESAAIEYRKENFKAKKYVFGVRRFTTNLIMGFEGVQNGKYTLEEVLEDFHQDMEDSQQHLVIPLKEIMQALEGVAGDVSRCIKDSGLLASEYEEAGRLFEHMKDITTELAKTQAASSVLNGVSQLLALSSGAVSTITGVFSVLSTTASVWGEKQHHEMKRTEKLLRDLHDEMGEVSRIMDEQRLLLEMICQLVGSEVTKTSDKVEKKLAIGKPTTHLQDQTLEAARELEALCSTFLGPIARR